MTVAVLILAFIGLITVVMTAVYLGCWLFGNLLYGIREHLERGGQDG